MVFSNWPCWQLYSNILNVRNEAAHTLNMPLSRSYLYSSWRKPIYFRSVISSKYPTWSCWFLQSDLRAHHMTFSYLKPAFLRGNSRVLGGTFKRQRNKKIAAWNVQLSKYTNHIRWLVKDDFYLTKSNLIKVLCLTDLIFESVSLAASMLSERASNGVERWEGHEEWKYSPHSSLYRASSSS